MSNAPARKNLQLSLSKVFDWLSRMAVIAAMVTQFDVAAAFWTIGWAMVGRWMMLVAGGRWGFFIGAGLGALTATDLQQWHRLEDSLRVSPALATGVYVWICLVHLAAIALVWGWRRREVVFAALGTFFYGGLAAVGFSTLQHTSGENLLCIDFIGGALPIAFAWISAGRIRGTDDDTSWMLYVGMGLGLISLVLGAGGALLCRPSQTDGDWFWLGLFAWLAYGLCCLGGAVLVIAALARQAVTRACSRPLADLALLCLLLGFAVPLHLAMGDIVDFYAVTSSGSAGP